MVGDRGLGDVVPSSDVARADWPGDGELSQDREADGVRSGLEQEHVRIGVPLHSTKCIDKFLLRQVSIQQQLQRGRS